MHKLTEKGRAGRAQAAGVVSAGVGAAPSPLVRTLEELLFEEGYRFDFFQAIRILERLAPEREPLAGAGPPQHEVVRLRAHLALSFPASAIFEIERPSESLPVPVMSVTFMGLTGPSGVLPQHYTELLLRTERDGKGPEKRALRAWLDLFNHRLVSLLFRAWKKYRCYLPYERGEYARRNPDPFTRSLFSFIGLGEWTLRNRLRVSLREDTEEGARERPLARIDDLTLLYYSGFLAHRPRCAIALEALLNDYFRVGVQVRQFQGQWLYLDRANQSRFSAVRGGNNLLGVDLVAGERVWDVQSKIRLRLGPLGYARFTEFLPDRTPTSRRKEFFLLCHLVRLYVGPELDFDVQLVLRAEEVPACQLAPSESDGPQLGWNTWIRSQPQARDADDAVFAEEELTFVLSNGCTKARPGVA